MAQSLGRSGDQGSLDNYLAFTQLLTFYEALPHTPSHLSLTRICQGGCRLHGTDEETEARTGSGSPRLHCLLVRGQGFLTPSLLSPLYLPQAGTPATPPGAGSEGGWRKQGAVPQPDLWPFMCAAASSGRLALLSSSPPQVRGSSCPLSSSSPQIIFLPSSHLALYRTFT